MRIGFIAGYRNKAWHHTMYYMTGLSLCEEIKQIYSNIKFTDHYNWFHGDNNKVIIKSREYIEKMNLDYIFYGYDNIICNKEQFKPVNTKSKYILMYMRDSIYFETYDRIIEMVDNCKYIFKISTPLDRKILYDIKKRPYVFRFNQLEEKNVNKVKPLFYVGSNPLNYPNYPFTRKYPISFYGAVTSLDRIKSIPLLKTTFKNDFHGGFVRDLRGKWGCDEDGNNICGIKVEKNNKWLDKTNYLKYMKDSIVNFSPSGWGRNTHRFIDILSMGGCALSCDISHIDYGKYKPIDGVHYVSYAKDQSNLIEKAKYLIKNPIDAEKIGNNAKDFMKQTYLNNKKMAKEYILKELI